jgi:phosphoadenosine phosphosulfate reductase
MPAKANTSANADSTLDVAALAEQFSTKPAEVVMAWAEQRFGTDLVVLVAMTSDVVLVDLVSRHAPSAQVVFLDTGHHFPETLAFVEAVRRHYASTRISVQGAGLAPADMWQTDPDGCCQLRKVVPMENALAGRRAWVSGMRRVDSPMRADVQVVQRDKRGLIKLNPLAHWSDDDLATFAALHQVPEHPLIAEGYTSIGCGPCTRKTAPGEHAREGRWAGSSKVECGLHI